MVESSNTIPFLVFKRNVASENVRVFNTFRHIRMARAVIKYQTTDELCVQFCLVLHFHNLNHVQVNWLT